MPTFDYVKPTDEQIEIMQKYRNAFAELHKLVEELEHSRGRSIALTKIEEAAMWVNKSITKND